jgi:electron transfer flavoprotein beta subunit
MKIGVCVKSTPDTAITRFKYTSGNDGIDAAQVKFTVNPYDEFAVEEAARMKEAHGGEVVAVTVGDAGAGKVLRETLAVGVDRGVHVDAVNTDSLATARLLAAVARSEGFGVLFCGKVAVDDQASAVPAMVAELLGWPHVSVVTAFSTDGATFTASRAVGGGVEEVVTGALPVVITAERGLNEPRYQKLKDIMAAKKKVVAVVTPESLGVSAADLAPVVTFSAYADPPERPKGRVIPGDAAEAARELVRLLRDEAKVL